MVPVIFLFEVVSLKHQVNNMIVFYLISTAYGEISRHFIKTGISCYLLLLY